MINLQSLHHKGVVLLKDVEFKFTPGIHVIRGLNKDDNNSPNGVGKSTLFLAMHGPTVQDLPHVARKRGKPEYTGKSTLRFSLGKDKYVVTCNYDKGGQLDVSKNGKALAFRKKDDARSYVKGLLPWNSDFYRTFIYLNSNSGNTFLHGTENERHVLLEKLLSLDKYDTMYERIKTYASRFKEFKASYDAVADTMVEAPSEAELDKLEADLARFEKTKVELEKTYKEMSQDYADRVSYIAILKQIPKEYRKVSVKDLMDRLKDRDAQLKALVPELEAAKANAANLKAFKEKLGLQKEVFRLLKALKGKSKAKVSRELEDCISSGKQTSQQLASLKKVSETEVKAYKTSLAIMQRYEEWCGKDIVNASVAELNTSLEEHKTHLKLLSSHNHAKQCPVCKSTLKGSIVTKLVKDLSDKISDIEYQLKLIQAYETASRQVRDPKLVKDTKRIPELELVLKLSRERYVELREILKQFEELARVKSRIKGMSSIRYNKSARKVWQVEEEMSPLSMERNIYMNVLTILDRAVNHPGHGINPGIKEEAEDVASQLKEVSETYYKTKARYDSLRHNYDANWKAKQKLKELDEKLKDEPIVKVLSTLLGPKGLRLSSIKSVLGMYEDGLNALSNVVYPKGYTFSVTAANRNLSIVAKRSGKESDIRRLSGWESRVFSLLNLLAMLPLIPSQLRCNTLILDEMEANLGTRNRTIFATDILKLLNKIIPCVVVVTPLSQKEMYIPDAKEYQVVKKNNQATLQALGSSR